MTSANKLSYYSHELKSLWEDIDEYIKNGDKEIILSRISELQESIPEIVDFVVEEMDELEIILAGAEAELKAAKEKYQLRVESIKSKIQSRNQLLVQLREKGILDDEVIGNSKRIVFQQNPPKIEELLIDPSSPEFPEQFRETRIEYIPLKKELLAAAKRGEDVSKVCKISRGISPRYKDISGAKRGRKKD